MTTVELRCRTTSRGRHDQSRPAAFVPRIFDRSIHGKSSEIVRLQEFVFAVMAVPRKPFLAVMSFLHILLQSLEAVESNLDLAYSMLVYGLESLSQSMDDFKPTWQDYPDATRAKIDKILARDVDVSVGSSIRDALLADAHVKLTQ
jgi:hypothetical protein